MGDGRSMGGRRGNGGRGEIGGISNTAQYVTTTKTIKQRKPRKKGQQLGIQGTGGGRFAPFVFLPNFVS